MQTPVLLTQTPGADRAFIVEAGEIVTATTGLVITERVGSARARQPVTVGNITVAPGNVVYVLHYAGEGFWLV